MQDFSGEAAVITTQRTCRDSLLRARLARVRETQDDQRAREAEREFAETLARLDA